MEFAGKGGPLVEDRPLHGYLNIQIQQNMDGHHTRSLDDLVYLPPYIHTTYTHTRSGFILWVRVNESSKP